MRFGERGLLGLSNPNTPSFLEEEFPLEWQMTRQEKYAIIHLLDLVKPKASLEIGTYKGGSLQVIASMSDFAYSVDVEIESMKSLADRFDNVEFVVGDSATFVPSLLETIERRGQSLEFVLIDGDHTEDGVRTDLNNVLAYVPSRPCLVLCHDSFHPPCRSGILGAAWQDCPYVHYVEVDFISGVYHENEFDTAVARSMYGGFMLAIMLPKKRSRKLVIHESQRGLYEAVLRSSRYTGTRGVFESIRPVLRMIRRSVAVGR